MAKARTKTVKPKILTKAADVRYAGYPTAVIYDKAGKGRKALRELLWGDWMVVTGKEQDGYRWQFACRWHPRYEPSPISSQQLTANS